MCAIVFVLSQCKNAGHVTYNHKYLLNVLFIPEVYIRYNDSFIRSTFQIRAMGCFLLWLYFSSLFLMPLLIIYIALPQWGLRHHWSKNMKSNWHLKKLNPIFDNGIHVGNAFWCLHAPLLSHFLCTPVIHRIPHIFHKSERSLLSKLGNYF